MPVRVPADAAAFRHNLPGWLIYRTTFPTPEGCLSPQASCSILLGEVGDAVEAHLNGVSLGRRGGFPPHARYSKHYPAHFDLSRDLLSRQRKKNELILTVYAMKKHQIGIRRGPIGIFSGTDGFRVARSLITFNMLIPILVAVGLFLIALMVSLTSLWRSDSDPRLRFYVWYCLSTALFLVSFSEVPREHLPIWIVGHLHFTLRILSDWAYFEMVCAYFSYPQRMIRWLRALYIIVVLSFAADFFRQSIHADPRNVGTAFDTAYVIMRLCFPALLLPHVLGLIGAARDRKAPGSLILLCLFSLLCVLQVWDSSIFHGYLSGTYTVKIYPLLIGLVLGYRFLEQSRQAHTHALLQQEQARHMRQIHEATLEVAHDLRTPLAGLRMACDQLAVQPDNRALVEAVVKRFSEQSDRIFRLTDAILRSSKELSSTPRLSRCKVDLVEFVQSVLREFGTLPAAAQIAVATDLPGMPVLASIDLCQFHRVLHNLLMNAAEACAGQDGARVTVSIRKPSLLNPAIEILIADNGPGIPEPVLGNLFIPFVSSGKDRGIGLGLASTKRLVEAHGGTIQCTRPQRQGTTFIIRLPV